MKILPWITLMAAALGTTAPVFSAEAPAAPAAVTNAVMQPALPGVAPAVAPTIIPGAPVRDVTLAFQDIAPAPGAMTLRGSSRTARLNLACAVMKWSHRPH